MSTTRLDRWRAPNLPPQQGKHKPQKPQNVHIQLKPGGTQSRKREQRNVGIIGTGTASNIPVIKTKLVSVFATRFSPDLDSQTLCDYLTEKLSKTVTCRRIDTTRAIDLAHFM